SLSKAVVDLVRSRMIQILALQIDFCPTPFPCQARGVIERSWPAGVLKKQMLQCGFKCRIGLSRLVGAIQLFERIHQRFGHELPAVASKMSFHGSPKSATSTRRTASIKRLILS